MADTPTTIIPLTAEQFAARMAQLVPPNWASQAAKQPGGVTYAVLQTGGGELGFEMSAEQYALGSTRIQTAVGPELDLASEDFFGDQLPRNPNESDVSFRKRIIDQLPPTGATRPAIIEALTKMTGVVPRVIEPWNVLDTGWWDGISYWDIDTQANPARWGDGSSGMRYQGFIITPGPTVEVLNGNPLLTFDDSAYWDIPGYGALDISGAPIENLYSLLNRMKVYGTIIWVQISHP